MGQGASLTEQRVVYDEEDPTRNPIDELQLLDGHTDIVRFVLFVNHYMLASASDDHTVILWDWRRCVLLHRLEQHTRPITCLVKLSPSRIASGSSDHKIIIWNVHRGEAIRVLEYHAGVVQSIIKIGSNQFCSGGNDKFLCIWDINGNKLKQIERQEEENLLCMLHIGNRIVTACSAALLLVYDVPSLSFVTILSYHRDSVCTLESISTTHFASGSLDGAIVIWHAQTLKPSKILSFPENFRSDESHIFTYHVRHIVCMNARYLAVAVGNGFTIYDLYSGEKVLDHPMAHDAPVLGLLSLYNGTRIATYSEDSSIKLWCSTYEESRALSAADSPGAHSRSDAASAEELGSSPAGGLRGLFARKKPKMLTPLCIGEMFGHSMCVNSMTNISQFAFASAGSDGLVIVWKDGSVQRQMRNNFANASLIAHQERPQDVEEVDEKTYNSSKAGVAAAAARKSHQRAVQVQASPKKRRGGTAVTVPGGMDPQHQLPQQAQQQQQQQQQQQLRQSQEQFVPPFVADAVESGDLDALPVSVRPTSPFSKYSVSINDDEFEDDDDSDLVAAVPEYIWSFAKRLRDEENKNIEEISDRLRQVGHSQNIVTAIVKKLQEGGT